MGEASISTREESKALVKIAVPNIVLLCSGLALALVDTSIVGHHSTIELGGVAVSRSLILTLSSFNFGTAILVEAFASQAAGAKEPDVAWKTLLNALKVGLWISPAVMAVVGVITLFLESFGVAPPVAHAARMYFLGNALSVFFLFGFQASKTFLQCHGASWVLLAAAAGANVINWYLCQTLVAGDAYLTSVGLPAVGLPALGALGAGLAGTLATTLLFIATWLAARKYRAVGDREAPSPGQLLKMGLPIGGMFLAEIGTGSVIALLAGRLSPASVAGNEVANSLLFATSMLGVGIGGATTIRVGHAVGAARPPRKVGLIGLSLGAVAAVCCATPFALFPEFLVGLFSRDPAVLAVGVSILRIAAVYQVADVLLLIAGGALRGVGDMLFPSAYGIACRWLIGIPLACVLGFGFHLGVPGMWYGLTAALVAIALPLMFRFFRRASGPVARLS